MSGFCCAARSAIHCIWVIVPSIHLTSGKTGTRHVLHAATVTALGISFDVAAMVFGASSGAANSIDEADWSVEPSMPVAPPRPEWRALPAEPAPSARRSPAVDLSPPLRLAPSAELSSSAELLSSGELPPRAAPSLADSWERLSDGPPRRLREWTATYRPAGSSPPISPSEDVAAHRRKRGVAQGSAGIGTPARQLRAEDRLSEPGSSSDGFDSTHASLNTSVAGSTLSVASSGESVAGLDAASITPVESGRASWAVVDPSELSAALAEAQSALVWARPGEQRAQAAGPPPRRDRGVDEVASLQVGEPESGDANRRPKSANDAGSDGAPAVGGSAQETDDATRRADSPAQRAAGSAPEEADANVDGEAPAKPDDSASISGNQADAALVGREARSFAAKAAEVQQVPLGITVDERQVSVGTPGHERRITNVAPGTAPTDAVNKGQLDDALAHVRREAFAGVAAAMAVAGLPQPATAGASMASFSSAVYRGEYGVAIGVSHVTSDKRWVLKFAGNASGRGHLGMVAAGGFQW